MKTDPAEHAVLALFCSAFVWMCAAQWPGLHWDAACYAPPILSAARGEGFAAAAYPSWNIRLEGTQTHHGLLACLLYGQVLECSDWERLLFCYGFVNAGTCFVWWWIFSRQKYLGVWNGWKPAAIMAGVAAGCLGVGLQGRPEHPAIVIAGIPFLLTSGSLIVRLCVLGVTTGLLFCCSPSAGVLGAAGVCLFLALRPDFSEQLFWKRFCLTGLLGISTFGCTTLLMPISLTEWLVSFARASQSTLDFSSHLVRFQNGGLWGTSILAPFWNVAVIFYFSAISGLMFLRRRWSPLIVFWIIALKHYHVFTDYGYACGLLPLLRIFLALAAATPLRSTPPQYPRIIRVASFVWLGSFLMVFVQYFTEAIAYCQLPAVRPQIIQLFEQSSPDEGTPVPVIAFVASTQQSYVAVGQGRTDFVPVAENAVDGNWTADEKIYFEKRKAVPVFLMAPPELVRDREELSIDGVAYRKYCQDVSSAHGLAFFRPRRVGYGFIAYRKTAQ
ncbi:MAG: hypothetical protein ACKO2P_10425 [Planctomycetota bacterium]